MSEHSTYITESVDELLRLYADMVYRLAYVRTKNRHDADDILQEVFLRYVKYQPKFDSAEHCKAWFICVTVNCSKTLLSSSWFRLTQPLDESFLFNMEENTGVLDAVMALPVKYRTVVHLYYYESYSVNEIAEMLKLSESAVKSRLRRARGMLKKALEQIEN